MIPSLLEHLHIPTVRPRPRPALAIWRWNVVMGPSNMQRGHTHQQRHNCGIFLLTKPMPPCTSIAQCTGALALSAFCCRPLRTCASVLRRPEAEMEYGIGVQYEGARTKLRRRRRRRRVRQGQDAADLSRRHGRVRGCAATALISMDMKARPGKRQKKRDG